MRSQLREISFYNGENSAAPTWVVIAIIVFIIGALIFRYARR